MDEASMEQARLEHLLQTKRSSMSASSSVDGDAYEAGCSRSTADLFCPCCFEEPFSLSELVQHAFEVHSHQSRSVRCLLCQKMTHNLKHHLLQHSAMPKGPPSSPSVSSPRSSKDRLVPRLSSTDRELGMLDSLPGPSSSLGPGSSGLPMAASRGTQLGSTQLLQTELPPPPAPRPALEDTPDTRRLFVQQLLLSGFGLDWPR